MLDRIPTRVVDVLVAVVVAAATLGNRLAEGHDAVAAALAVAISFLVVARRRHPIVVLATLTIASLLLAFGGEPPFVPALVIAFFSAAEFLPRRESLRVCAEALAAVAVAVAIDDHGGASSSFVTLVFLSGAWVFGDNARTRRERIAVDAERAVADERARIARELHDMVTHNVSVMVVQAAAGNEVIDEHPEQARVAFRAVEETGRRALGELRRLLDVVADDDAAEYDPQPGLERLDALVESVRATGLGVDLTVEGTPQALPPAVELSAFRIVQESLTNTLRHAGATHATVRVRYAPDALELEVADDGLGASSTEGGRGLVGMRERVALFGGELLAGAAPGGGFAVRARMPLEAS